jgi:hypothetical protein
MRIEMEFVVLIFMLLLSAVSFTYGLGKGTDTATQETREKTVIFCNQKPQECKKEFELYQLKKEVETFKMEELK